MIPLEDHVRLQLCHHPRPRRKYATQLWICPQCGLAWNATQTPDPHFAPDGLSWRWVLWQPGEGFSR